MKIALHPEPYDPWQALSDYQSGSDLLTPGGYGACAAFVGTMRDFNEGDNVSGMFLEHYPGMTEGQLEALATETIARHELLDVLILHRTGEVFPDDPIVLVAAWSAHRAAAFDGCREMMEMLKSRATFWKKEILSGEEGAQRWVARNTPG